MLVRAHAQAQAQAQAQQQQQQQQQQQALPKAEQGPLPEGWREAMAPLHGLAEPEGLSDWPAGLPADWAMRGLPRRRGLVGAARAQRGEMPEPHLRAGRRARRDGGEMPGPERTVESLS